MENKPKGNEEDPGQVWEDILLLHILPKLPVKSLFRFKCVCKNWLRWISHDPAFIREQSRCSLASPGVVFECNCGYLEFLSTGGNPIDVPDPFLRLFKRSGFSIESSCNGLLCLSINQLYSTRAVYVGNPVTGEWSLIPGGKDYNHLALAFDPLDSLPTYNLVSPYYNGLEYCFEVFSSDTGVWTMSGAKLVTKRLPIWDVRSLFKGGIFYWSFETSVVWFNLKKDLAGVLLLPVTDGLEHIYGKLGMWEGEPSYTRMIGEKLVEAWTLIEFKWTRIYRVSLDSIIQAIRTPCGHLVLHYHWGNLFYFGVLFYGEEHWFICYDMKKGEVIESRKCKKSSYLWLFLEYSNSFVRVPKLSKCPDV